MNKEALGKKIFYGGSIITMNDNQPIVSAVGIDGEKIIAKGTLEDVKKALGNEYDLADLKGKTLLPGFIDSHMHPISFMFLLMNLDLSNVKS
ncbi:MAG: amidohydrolase family protein, partial [Promethearchaeota archaeon]